jgi:hypothetical protein
LTLPETFVSELAALQMPAVFNPWRDHCRIHDRAKASAVRQRNLQRFLQGALDGGADTIWVARDLGYRGGRRTGIPMTDEVNLGAASQLLGGKIFERATQGPPVAERTAAVIWQMLARVGRPVVLWNVFPFHPHDPENPFSNRCHTRAERRATWSIMERLIAMVRPQHIVAIGRDSQTALAEMGVRVSCVRHPSYGGQTEFVNGITSIYGLENNLGSASSELPLAH